jgi:predicted ribosomally synthesized peptide with nif11-like leader
MSTESAKKFVKRMQEDKAFVAAVETLSSKEDRAAFVKNAGFEFTREEFAAVASELNAVDVVGGKCCGVTCEGESPPIHYG